MNKHFNPQLMLLAAAAALTMAACTDDNNGDKPGIDDGAYVGKAVGNFAASE